MLWTLGSGLIVGAYGAQHMRKMFKMGTLSQGQKGGAKDSSAIFSMDPPLCILATF